MTAVVSLGDGAPGDLTPDEALGSDAVGVPADAALLELVRTHVKEQLAAYKAPQHVVVVPAVMRGPNGKADYRWAGEVAASALG